jgi:hypothetical protein
MDCNDRLLQPLEGTRMMNRLEAAAADLLNKTTTTNPRWNYYRAAYLKMARFHRPKKTGTHSKRPHEAAAFADDFLAEEEICRFYVSKCDPKTIAAFAWIIEAARSLPFGADRVLEDRAIRLLEAATNEIRRIQSERGDK